MIQTIKVEELERLGAVTGPERALKSAVPIGVSARHLHLTQEHVEKLFGQGHQLTTFRGLSQPGQFACAELVTLKTARGSIEGVRLLGPARPETQIELSLTDTFRLKLDEPVPVRMSGHIAGTPGLTLVGTAGEVTINEGVIINKRHIHMTPRDAEEYGCVDNQILSVLCGTERQMVFCNVVVRVREDFRLDFHIDTDEANAAGVKAGDIGYILRPSLAFQNPGRQHGGLGCSKKRRGFDVKILVLNCGSSSVKYQVFSIVNGEQADVLAGGIVEEVGLGHPTLKHTKPGMDKLVKRNLPVRDHKDAIKIVVETLCDPTHGVLGSVKELQAVGHRVVHGGEEFASSVRIDEDVVKAMYDNIRAGAPAQSAQYPGHRGGQSAAARYPSGRRVRHRLPPDHAARRVPVRHPLRACTRSTGSAATGSTAPRTSTWRSRRPSTWASRCPN